MYRKSLIGLMSCVADCTLITQLESDHGVVCDFDAEQGLLTMKGPCSVPSEKRSIPARKS